MKRRTRAELSQELQDAGAAPQDARQLVRLASGLRLLKARGPHLASRTGWSFRRRQFWPVLPPLALTGAAGLVVGLLLVALAQTSFPGSWLYPLKRASETVALQAQPDYRGVMMMRRAEEVRKLVSGNGSQRLVATTLHDYAVDASAYQAQTRQNYAAFRYCQTNLQQAESQANGQERQAIAVTLASFPVDTN